MKNREINSQLSNFKTYEMYKRQLLTLAENVFEFDKMPNFIDTAFLNKSLLRKGSIAFFKDEELGLLALPYIVLGELDVYGRPKKIKVMSRTGYSKTINNTNDFVIMYDNNGRYPLYLDIIQYAERLAMLQRVIDINSKMQRTPRIVKTKQENEKTIRDLFDNVDAFEELIMTYSNLDIDDTTMILAPAPYVADKVDLEKDKIYNEFLRLIGVANISYQKKERNISDEIYAMQGGTIASRYSRFEPRKKAVELINEKFGENIEVKYYDGIPTSEKEVENFVEEGGDLDANTL